MQSDNPNTTDDALRSRLEQLDRAILDTRRYLDKLTVERHELLLLKYAATRPGRAVKVCDAI